MCLGENQQMVEIGHVNIGIIFFCIGKSQWWLYNTLSIPSHWLFNTQSRVLQAYWSMFENNELLTLTCPINPKWILHCVFNFWSSHPNKSVKIWQKIVLNLFLPVINAESWSTWMSPALTFTAAQIILMLEPRPLFCQITWP